MTKIMVAKKKQKAVRSKWADLAAETSIPVAALEVLAEHHATLNTFCANTYSLETYVDTEDDSSAGFELSFHQYCVALSTLIQYGSFVQQFEYLYHTYVTTNEHGIDRSELFELLKDHSERVATIVVKNDKLQHVTDPRHFDKLYTWLKKNFILYDETKSGFLPVHLTLEMLQTHPTALSHLKFQLGPFIKKTDEVTLEMKCIQNSMAVVVYGQNEWTQGGVQVNLARSKLSDEFILQLSSMTYRVFTECWSH